MEPVTEMTGFFFDSEQDKREVEETEAMLCPFLEVRQSFQGWAARPVFPFPLAIAFLRLRPSSREKGCDFCGPRDQA